MDPNQSESRRHVLHRDLGYRIINAFFEVYNALGPGFLESVYAKALMVALRKRGIEVAIEVPIQVFFDGHVVGTHRLDMLVEKRVVIELKSTETLPKTALRQTRSYLAAANLELGIILHFGPEAKYHRVIANKRSR
jgi:GxxExxY protein